MRSLFFFIFCFFIRTGFTASPTPPYAVLVFVPIGWSASYSSSDCTLDSSDWDEVRQMWIDASGGGLEDGGVIDYADGLDANFSFEDGKIYSIDTCTSWIDSSYGSAGDATTNVDINFNAENIQAWIEKAVNETTQVVVTGHSFSAVGVLYAMNHLTSEDYYKVRYFVTVDGAFGVPLATLADLFGAGHAFSGVASGSSFLDQLFTDTDTLYSTYTDEQAVNKKYVGVAGEIYEHYCTSLLFWSICVGDAYRWIGTDGFIRISTAYIETGIPIENQLFLHSANYSSYRDAVTYDDTYYKAIFYQKIDCDTRGVGVVVCDYHGWMNSDAGKTQQAAEWIIDQMETDTDGDGMYDSWEITYDLDPETDDSSGDPDGDDISNLEEFEAGSDPTSADSDGDGVSNSNDLCASTSSIDANDTVNSSGCALSELDSDSDSLSDYQETILYGTNPLSNDSDGDGVSDSDEVTAGSNPSDNTSVACVAPASGTDWTISSHCTLTSSKTWSGDLFIENNSVMTIPSGTDLDLDFVNQKLVVKEGSGILVKDGGLIY